MKFMKKAAALIFCLALALSVMAISASAADDEAQLLSATVDSNTTLKLVDTTASNSDINGENGKEYTSGTGGTVAIQLSSTNDNFTVNAFEFTVGTGASGATVTLDTVAGSSDFSITESNNGKYTFSTNAASGVTVATDPVTVATIAFTVASDTPGATNTISISGFKLLNTTSESGEALRPATDNASVSVEVDPQYTVTVKNPSVDSDGIIEAVPTYNATIVSNSYKILAGKSAATSTPTLSHYEFTGFVVDTTESTGSWQTLTGDDCKIASVGDLDTLLDNHANWGDLVLNAQYTPTKFVLTVKKATPQSNGTIDKTSYANYGYVTTDVTQYQYDIEGNVFDTSGSSTALNATTVAVPYYDFKEFVPVESASGSGNWVATETQNPTAGSYTFPTGKWGNVEFDATYTPKVYTITINQPPVNGNGIITTGTSVAFTTAQSVEYTVEGKVSADDNAQDATLPASLTKTAYTFANNYKVETDSENGWGGENATISSIGVGKHGNVTLVAQFTPTTYTVTYDLDGGAFTGTYNDKTAVSPKTATTATYSNESEFKYTIEDTDDDASNFTFGTPVKPGYNFTGWTAAKVGDGEYGTFPAASATANYAGVYGNVKLTATWAIEGKFATTDYWYGKSENDTTDMLILFAVPTANVPTQTIEGTTTQVGAYKFGSNAMFKTTKYASVFPASGDNALTNGTEYTIFAYIGSGTDVTADSFSYDAAIAANESVSYDGNVTGDTEKDAADYGNVVAMLANRAYENGALTVKARLEADMDDGNDTDRYFGTIADVRAIMNAVLGNTSSTTPEP